MGRYMYFIDPKVGNYAVATLKTVQKINYTVVTKTFKSIYLQQTTKADVQIVQRQG